MKKDFRRVLSFLMALLMAVSVVFSDASLISYAEESTVTTYEKVTSLNDVLEGGDFVVVAQKDSTFYAMDSTVNNNKLTPVEVSVSDNEITGDKVPVWSVSATDKDNNKISIKSGDSYFYYTGAKTNVNLQSDSYSWLIADNGNGNFELTETTSESNNRIIGFSISDSYEAIGAYAASNKSDSRYAFDLMLYKVSTTTVSSEDSESTETTPTETTPTETTPTETTPTETTSTETTTSVLVKDGTYVIYNPSSKMAMSQTATGTYYRASVEMILKEDGTFDSVNATEIWTIKNNTDGTITISSDAGTLGTSSSQKSANFDTTNEYTTWNLTETSDGTYYVSSTKPEDKNGKFYLEWYSTYTEFTTYSTSAEKLGDAFKMQFVPVTASSATETETDTTDNGYSGQYVIYNAANSMALSHTYSGNYNAGVSMTLNANNSFDSVLATEVWTFTKNSDGNYTISQGDDKLSMDTSYSSTPLNKANDSWEITDNGDGTVYIKNVGRNTYLEWYADKNNWSTYNKIGDTSKNLFAQTLVKVTDDMIKSDSEEESTDKVVSEGLHYIYSASAAGIMKYGVTAGCASYVEATVNDDVTLVTTETSKLEGAAVLDFAYDSSKEAYTIKCGSSYLAANSSEELYLAETTADTSSACTYWVIEKNENLNGYTIKSKSVKYNSYDVYMEYYSSKGFCLYTAKTLSDIYAFNFPVAASDSDTDGDGYAYAAVPVAAALPEAGSTVVISNDANGQVMASMIEGKDGAESSMGAVDATVTDGKIDAENGALIFTVGIDNTTDFSKSTKFNVTIDDNGYYSFTYGGKYLTGSADGKSISLADKASDYSLWKLETNDDGYYLVNVNAVYTYTDKKSNTYKYDAAVEYYSGNFTLYELDITNTKYSGKAYTMQFYDADGNKLDSLTSGTEVIIYNPANNYTLSAKAASSNTKLAGTDVSSGYYYFENNGKYLATNNDEELLVQSELNDMAKWKPIEVVGGYLLKSKAAAWTSSSGNSYPIYIEYFSGAFAGYSYKATSASIFTFNLYEVEDTYKTGYVINPTVKFNTEAEANWEVNYTMNFTLNDLGTTTKTGVKVTFEDGTEKTYEAELKNYDGKVVIDGDDLVGHTSMEIEVSATSKETDTVSVDYKGTKTVTINDEPAITAVTPQANAQTENDYKPSICINYANIGKNAKATLTINGTEVELKQNTTQKYFNFTPSEDLTAGKNTLVATITRADGKVATKTWSFNVGNDGIGLYFGQIHSHTAEYSDGSGTLEQAYEYAMSQAADTDYMIVTDHSNYFDTTSSATTSSIYDAAADSIKDSTTKDSDGNVLNLWQEAKATAAEYNAKSDDFVAGYGYEMTWSGGPGHINVFNSLGIVSRNNTELNSKTNNEGMLKFYDLLSDANEKNATYTGDSAISAQFNHPGTTFGYFDSFTGWTEDRDEIMNLIEVGNGDGAIGGTAYFPSYEYYDMCLTAGWHVAPTNGQDNHKGSWGDSNTARTVAITSEFTENGLYDAMSARHIYSTEDQNLSVIYYLDDTLQGGIIDCDDAKVSLAVSLSDEDSEALGYVYVIGLDGKVLYTSDYLGENTADLSISLDNTDPYYYVKVVEKDGDIAVTAPVWVDDVVTASDITASLSYEGTPAQNEKTTFKAVLANGEEKSVTVQSYSISVDGEVVKSETVTETLDAGKKYTVSFDDTPKTYGKHSYVVSFTYLGSDNKLVTKTASKDVYVKGTEYDTVSTIAKVKKGNEKEEFTIEGYVTANTSGYDQNTAFFDCTYVQDSTGGINVFPVSNSLQIGQHVRLHGAITYYNGEMELNLSEDYGGYIEVIDDTTNIISGEKVTAKEAMADENIGSLMTITGTVTRVNYSSDVVDRIYVQDETGTACVYINGYIWNSQTKSFENFGADGLIPAVGDTVTVTGIGSVDVDELGEVEYLHRLRIRDRAEITVTKATAQDNTATSSETDTTSESGNASSAATEEPEATPIRVLVAADAELKEINGLPVFTYKLSSDGYLKMKLFEEYHGIDGLVLLSVAGNVGASVKTTDGVKLTKNIDLKVSMTKTEKNLIEGYNTFKVTPRTISEVGCEVTLHFNLGLEYVGRRAYFFSHNKADNSYTLVGSMLVNEIGNVCINTTNLNDMLILVPEK